MFLRLPMVSTALFNVSTYLAMFSAIMVAPPKDAEVSILCPKKREQLTL